jgi:hypothetical protein
MTERPTPIDCRPCHRLRVTEPSASVVPGGEAAWKTAVIFLGVILLCVGSGVAALRGGADATDGYDARSACVEFIQDRLTSPLTADFSNLYHSGESPAWTVAGTVEAENSVGKRVRMAFSCVVRIDGQTWRLQSLTGLS